MSQITIGITDEQLKRVDAAAARRGATREQIALAGLELALAAPDPEPKKPKTVAAPKPNAGANKEE